MSPPFGERDLLRWLLPRIPPGPGVVVGPGDDGAVLQPPPGGLVVAADPTVEDVHFRRRELSWELVGRKALARNLSDLAAMAARPWTALVCLSVPDDVTEAEAQAVMTGLLTHAQEEETTVVGGDVGRSPQGLRLDVTVLGTLEARPPWRRRGALVGDELLVTGALGGSGTGHHAGFQPRWREALALAETGHIHAAIDLSDGLARDLVELTTASQVGARVEAGLLPRRPGQGGELASVRAALEEGEDFELLLAAAPGHVARLAALPALAGTALTRIGVVTAGGLELVSEDGNVTAWGRGGYEHRFGC